MAKHARSFTEARLSWLDEVQLAADVSHLQARVCGILAVRYANRQIYEESGRLEAWPSQVRLAKDAQCSVEGLRKALLGLTRCGFVNLHPGRGRRNNSRYYLISRRPFEVMASEKPQPGLGVVDEKPQPGLGIVDKGKALPRLVFSEAENPNGRAAKSPTATTTNPLNDPHELNWRRARQQERLYGQPMQDWADGDELEF